MLYNYCRAFYLERKKVTMAEKTMHIGGKVDIYLKGSSLSQKTYDFLATTNTLCLSKKYSEINLDSVNAVNTTDTTRAVQIEVSLGQDDEAIVTVVNSDNQSYNSSSTSEIQVSYLDNTGESNVEKFNVGAEVVQLDSPCIGTIHVSESGDSTKSFDKTYYDMTRTKLDGTKIDEKSPYYLSNQELAYFRFHDTCGVKNGTPISVNYAVNESVRTLDDYYNRDENRIITTDLLIKEAGVVYVNMRFSVVLKENETMTDARRSQIEHAIGNYISGLKIGDSIKESDVIGAVYGDASIMEYLYYINLPFSCFYSPKDPTELLPDEDRRDTTIITPGTTEYISLNRIGILSNE